MVRLFRSPLAYLSVSFMLFLIAVPLISVGTTSGPRLLLWLGVAALCIAGVIPPLQRLLQGSAPAGQPDDKNAD